jgi:minor extracellular serine protease Vpr
MMKRRLFALLLVAILAVTSATSVTAAQPTPGTVDPNSVITLDQPSYTPRGLDGSVISVVVRLKAQSVSEVQAMVGRKLSQDESDTIAANLKAEQDALLSAIQTAGGVITDQFQYAINGVRVQIDARKAGQLSALPNVMEVLPVLTYTVENSTSVPYIGAPAVWDAGVGLHGEGIKVGIIDTGLDYTHANFGGPGTEEAYAAAHALETEPADPALFGPDAAKVKGGYDLVGDAYAAGASLPQPDPNPLDCNGHGSHVGGTTAGFGVTADGATYTGSYDSSIYTPGAFRIGPGVAPAADLYGYRVFGCTGSTDVVVDAIDMAVKDGMDVINMSLGSPFGVAKTADAVAANNAMRAGVIVVTSAGNSGPNPYIVGSPSTGDGPISVAASDPYESFPGATLTLSTGVTMEAINANGATLVDGTVYNIVTLVNNPATSVDESLGCNVSDYPASLPANTLAVVNRGVCARVAKAIRGQQAGAAAVAMVNNSTVLPPYEGAIFSNPDTGEPYTVTIPLLGVRGLPTTASSDGGRLRAANGGTAILANALISNPGYSGIASFSSGGARNGDSYLKPEITAPGVSTFSTAVGTGNQGEFLSGTSMAAPHVAGVAALVKQAHPTWKVKELKAAIVSTGNPDAVAGYIPRLAGAGLVQPYAAVMTNAVATGGENGIVALNFGFQELTKDFAQTGVVKVRNRAATPVTFNVSVTNQSGVPHSLTPAVSSVTIAAGQQTDVAFRLNLPAATAGDSNAFYDAGGIITLTPANGGNNGVVLHVPYYIVPRPLAILSAKLPNSNRVKTASPTALVTISNRSTAVVPGNADFYAWGIHTEPTAGQTTNDVRDVGVQAFANAGGANNPLMVFAVNTYKRWSTPTVNEFDIYVDVDPQNNNGDDYIVVGVDYGAITTGTFNGQMGTFVYSTRSSGTQALNPAYTFAPTDSSTVALAILGSQLCRAGQPCLSVSNPRFTYHIVSFDVTGTAVDDVAGVGSFNPYTPAVSTGDYLGGIAPGTSANVTLTVNPAEWAKTPPLGVLVLTTENRAGMDEAIEIPLLLK